jgi:hypothetical protein
MPKPGDYVLMSLNKVFTAWGKQKMQLGDVYKVTCSAPGEEFEWVPYTEKIIKAKGISLADVLEWSKADGQVAMWRDYILAHTPPAKKNKTSPQKKKKATTAGKGKGKGRGK